MKSMPSTLGKEHSPQGTQIHTTLLDLLDAVNRATRDSDLAVATVVHLINSRNARLTGSSREKRLIIRYAGSHPR